MTEPRCPFCHAAIDYYLDGLDEDDDVWEVTIPFRHAADEECEGCNQISEGEWEIACRECGEDVWVTCLYVQPCNANGYVLSVCCTQP